MKGGKHAEKTTTPTFPRLYVNDVEKGGPRPPSRNKMALYEKRSIPSRRLSSGSASMLPPSPSNLSRLVSSGSSSPVGSQERDVNRPIHNTAPPGGLPKNMEQNSKRKSVTSLNCNVLNASKDLSLATKCNLFQPCTFSVFESPFLKKHEDEFGIPTFPHVDEKLGSSSNEFDICGEKFNVLHMNTSVRLQSFGVTSQHRLFSMQVFDLCRLIKVQKAIASSLHLLEDNLILYKHLVEASPMKKLPKLVAQLPMSLSPLKSSNKHLKIITPIENSIEKPLHAFNYDIRKVAYSWSDFAKPSATSTGTDTRLAMWCLHPPPGNQWFVPVISPSEVLVYKPYMLSTMTLEKWHILGLILQNHQLHQRAQTLDWPCGACTHHLEISGFTTPVYGGRGLFTVTPSGSSSLYGGPTSHQHGMEFLCGIPLFQSYSAPYSRPTVNSSLPPVVQQVRIVARVAQLKMRPNY
ncbi:hypothetical protein Ancab_012343 [Ancistrocladus abbreviatus]